MFSLIAAVLTIALLSALALVAINYTPWWLERAQASHELAAAGLVKLERAYVLSAASHSDTPPAPTAAADGGLSSQLRPYFGYLPKGPPTTTWVYGHQSTPGTFADMDFLCIQGTAVDQGDYRALSRLSQTLGSGQAVLSSTCGATTSASAVTAFPAAVAFTYYIAYVPGAR